MGVNADITEWNQRGIKIDGKVLSNMRYADDIVLLARNPQQAETLIKELYGSNEEQMEQH